MINPWKSIAACLKYTQNSEQYEAFIPHSSALIKNAAKQSTVSMKICFVFGITPIERITSINDNEGPNNQIYENPCGLGIA